MNRNLAAAFFKKIQNQNSRPKPIQRHRLQGHFLAHSASFYAPDDSTYVEHLKNSPEAVITVFSTKLDLVDVIHILNLYHVLYFHPMATLEKTLNVRIPPDVHAQLAELQKATGRTKSFLALEALSSYIDQQRWQIAEVKAGIAEADRGEFATDADMNRIFAKYAG